MFAALSVVSFFFREDRLTFLLHTPYAWIIGALLGLVFLLLLPFARLLPGGQKVGLGILYLMLPFTFWFSGKGIDFLFQPAQAGVALGCCATALRLLVAAGRGERGR